MRKKGGIPILLWWLEAIWNHQLSNCQVKIFKRCCRTWTCRYFSAWVARRQYGSLLSGIGYTQDMAILMGKMKLQTWILLHWWVPLVYFWNSLAWGKAMGHRSGATNLGPTSSHYLLNSPVTYLSNTTLVHNSDDIWPPDPLAEAWCKPWWTIRVFSCRVAPGTILVQFPWEKTILKISITVSMGKSNCRCLSTINNYDWFILLSSFIIFLLFWFIFLKSSFIISLSSFYHLLSIFHGQAARFFRANWTARFAGWWLKDPLPQLQFLDISLGLDPRSAWSAGMWPELGWSLTYTEIFDGI